MRLFIISNANQHDIVARPYTWLTRTPKTKLGVSKAEQKNHNHFAIPLIITKLKLRYQKFLSNPAFVRVPESREAK